LASQLNFHSQSEEALKDSRNRVRQVTGFARHPGDSGGPAFSVDTSGDLTVLGILSLGEAARFDGNTGFTRCLGHKSGGNSTEGNIYTDIRAYRQWIAQTSAKL
jgi:secreted trypsin-like serine protease